MKHHRIAWPKVASRSIFAAEPWRLGGFIRNYGGHVEIEVEGPPDAIGSFISHIVRGQDHLTNTFKHILILEAEAATLPEFAHLPLLIAPDGSKLSKRKHGPVVSVTT